MLSLALSFHSLYLYYISYSVCAFEEEKQRENLYKSQYFMPPSVWGVAEEAT
jgi:hypothetical protein